MPTTNIDDPQSLSELLRSMTKNASVADRLLWDHKNFPAYLHDVHVLYQKDSAFQELVHTFGGIYLMRTVRALGSSEVGQNERWRRLAHEYLLEEIALFACLAENGWSTLVYPGSIDSIVEVAEGRHPSVPAPLRAFQYIALWLDAKSVSR